MKILLLTGIPPTKGYTGGLLLHQLCSLLPRGSLACFVVASPELKDAIIASELSWIPTEYVERPREYTLVRPGRLRSLSTLALDSYNSTVKVGRIANKAIEFGHKFGADALWCLLEGQTMIRLALPVSKGLGAPLLAQVMDPPSWWLREYLLDRISRTRVLNEFDRVLQASVSCAAISWAMAEQYHRDYGIRTVPVMPSLDSQAALPPARRVHPGEDFVIGMAGQTYAADEWRALIAALDKANWKLGDRNVKIRLLGRELHLRTGTKEWVEFLGWRSQKETIELLTEADVLYCPYWFNPNFETVTRLSFPSKLATYLAVGRPVLFHGPKYASPARFLEQNDAAVFCHSLEHSEIIDSLERLISNPGLYSRVTSNGRAAFLKHLSFASQRTSFAEFLQIEEDWLEFTKE